MPNFTTIILFIPSELMQFFQNLVKIFQDKKVCFEKNVVIIQPTLKFWERKEKGIKKNDHRME
jgi:hypothetical protein